MVSRRAVWVLRDRHKCRRYIREVPLRNQSTAFVMNGFCWPVLAIQSRDSGAGRGIFRLSFYMNKLGKGCSDTSKNRSLDSFQEAVAR